VYSVRLRTRRLVSAFTSRPPSEAGDRREQVSTRRIRGPAELGLRRRATSMLFRNERGNTLDAPGTHADVGRPQRCFVSGCGRQGGPSGFPGCIARSEPCCDAKPIGMFCVPMVPGVSCLAGSVGIESWRQRRGRVSAGPHIGRAFRAADQKRWLFRFR
jgi:hypothetical protein